MKDNKNLVDVNFESFQNLDDSKLFEIYGMASFVLNGRIAERALSANIPVKTESVPVEPVKNDVVKTEKTKTRTTKTTKKSENKVSEPIQTAKTEECEHFLRDGKLVYKSPCHMIDKAARGGIRHTAIELGGTILKAGNKRFDIYHVNDVFTMVIEFKKVADAKAFLASQSKYHFKKCEPVPESAK